MTNACPNALSLAVAVAISSSMMGTQAQADRRLQTKSIDIQSDGHAEFIRSEVMVQPTLGDDQQPIPNSFTTSYPDQSQRNTDYVPPSLSFTAVLSGVDGGVYSVDQFETGKNNLAQKYTKVLKVGDEGVFRFTHNLDKKALHIEVRGGMTDPDSIAAVRAQLGCVPSLEPSTKIATPLQLAFLLEGVDDRAGSLGRSDHYVALASIEVEKVEVNGRTFMRLIAAGDQPPELQSLGQSLFVNDEVLLTAAASAYIQVHVLGEDLQQQALNDLLAYSKPVGYVVHAEDDTEVYPVPPGYPKLEVSEAPGEVIVFHGQKQNPHDIAFVENLYKLWVKAWLNNRTPAAATRVNKYKVKSYQYVIRSRQMELLDQFANQLAAHPNAELDEDQLMMLADYESLQQALSSATPDAADEFQLAIRHIKVAESIITSPWIQVQLAKHFGFKPALRNLLTNEHFLKEFMSIVNGEAANAFDYDEEFASKSGADMTRQILERESRQKELQTKEVRLAQLKKLYHLEMDKANPNDEEQLTTQRHYQNIEGELAEVRVKLEDLKNQERKLQREVKRIPELEQQVRDARKEASNHYNAQFAKELGIVNWDDTQPQKEQARRITGKLNEIFRAVAATKQPEEEAVKTNLAAIEVQLGIAPDNENDLDARFQSIQRHLQQKEKLTDEAIWNRLIVIEQLGEQHLQHLQKLKKQKNWLQELQQELDRTPALRREVRDPIEKTITDYYVQLAEGLGISNWVVTEPFEEQARLIRKNIHKIKRSGKSRKKAVIEKLAAVEGQYNIFPNNENDLEARFQSIEQHLQQHLQQQTELIEGVIRNRLANLEVQLGLVPGDEEQMAYRQDLIRQHLRQQIDQVDQDYLRQQSIKTGAEKIAATKARFASIAKHLNIQNFDDNEDIETQQKRLIQRIQTLNTHAAKEETFVKLRQEAMATVLGLELNEDSTLEDRQELIEHRQLRLYRLADFEKELEHISVSGHPITTLSELEDVLQDIRTPGHPRFKPEVLDKLSAVEEALEMRELNSEDDEYYRRQAISRDIQTYISEARERAEEDAQDVLRAVEEILGINVNESDDKGKRLDRILAKLADDEVTEKKLSDIHNALWGEEDFTPANSIAKVRRLSERLSLYVMDSDLRATTQQTRLLKAIEDELGIDRNEHVAAKERGKNFVAKLADDLKIDIVKDASLNNQKAVLKARFQALDDAVSKPCDDEGKRRGIHNEIAYQLGIQGYRDDAPADDQTHLIKEKLQQLNKAVFMAGWPKFNERITAINAELDRLMACLGPKPRYVLDREVAKAKSDTEKANSELEKLRRKLDAVHRKQVVIAHPDDVHPDTDKVITALNQVMKHIHTELGLTQDDNHTPEDLLDDIERFLQKEDDAVRRVETVQKLRDTIKELKIPFKNDPDNQSEADHIKVIREYTASHGRDKVDQALGELPETRRQYAQVRKFLHEYDFRATELANAQDEEKQAREALDTKNQAIGHSKDINPKAKTQLERSREVLDLVLEQKKAITSEAQEALKAHEAKLKAIEDHVGLKPAPTARYADRVDALRNKQIEMGGLDGTGGKILQLTQKQDRLNRQIEFRTAEIEQLKEVLKAAEKAVENEGGPFQYTPKQANILTDIYAF
ncbi:hypothetical protein, partial [Endozoicomonas sp. ONNA1]|uniref:hypothetical protein n=1 Tax=Endozoicomonas sp. ONNA1 TaxID=2828740 RepID=UPI0021476E78